MSQCVSSPTSTQFTTITSTTVSTTTSESISSQDAELTTITTTSCGTGAASTSCATLTGIEFDSGGETTIQVPVVVTLTLTSTSPTSTLYGTSCAGGGTASDSTATDTNVQTNTGASVTSTTSTTSTGTITFTSSYTSGGSVIYTTGTSTTTTVLETSSVVAVSSSKSSTHVGAIVGGVVGGVVGAIILALIGWYLIRRSRRRRELENIVWPDASGRYEKHDYPRVGETVHSPGGMRPYTYNPVPSPAFGDIPNNYSPNGMSAHYQDIPMMPTAFSQQSPLPVNPQLVPLHGPIYPSAAATSPHSEQPHPAPIPSFRSMPEAPALTPVVLSSTHEEESVLLNSTNPWATQSSSQNYSVPEIGPTAQNPTISSSSASGSRSPPLLPMSRSHVEENQAARLQKLQNKANSPHPESDGTPGDAPPAYSE